METGACLHSNFGTVPKNCRLNTGTHLVLSCPRADYISRIRIPLLHLFCMGSLIKMSQFCLKFQDIGRTCILVCMGFGCSLRRNFTGVGTDRKQGTRQFYGRNRSGFSLIFGDVDYTTCVYMFI
jgi:hypothetical protein